MGTTTSGQAHAPDDAGYVLLDHTADVGVKAWGPDAATALAAVTRGMYAITLGRDPARVTGEPVSLEVAVSGDTWPDVVVNWLAELLFSFTVEGMVAQSCAFTLCAPPECKALVTGVCYGDEHDAEGGIEIKAVTYHELRVDISRQRTTIQVYFDV